MKSTERKAWSLNSNPGLTHKLTLNLIQADLGFERELESSKIRNQYWLAFIRKLEGFLKQSTRFHCWERPARYQIPNWKFYRQLQMETRAQIMKNPMYAIRMPKMNRLITSWTFEPTHQCWNTYHKRVEGLMFQRVNILKFHNIMLPHSNRHGRASKFCGRNHKLDAIIKSYGINHESYIATREVIQDRH